MVLHSYASFSHSPTMASNRPIDLVLGIALGKLKQTSKSQASLSKNKKLDGLRRDRY